MPENEAQRKRLEAAQHTFKDVLGELRAPEADDGAALMGVTGREPHLDGVTIATLLEKNFSKLDPNGNGITREELAQALISQGSYSRDEYAMLQLIGKYFDTIANMCEDEQGPQSVITSLDKDVLNQFLMHSNLSLAELHQWRSTPDATT
jgi:hypothetical protein